MKSTSDKSQSSRLILFTTRSNKNYSTRDTINKTIHDTNEKNIQITNTNKIKYNHNDLQHSIRSTNQYASRSVPNQNQWILLENLSISGITLPLFQKRKTIINKVDQFLNIFKLKKRKLSKNPYQIQTTATKKRLNIHSINKGPKTSRVHKFRNLFSISKKVQHTITIYKTGRRQRRPITRKLQTSQNRIQHQYHHTLQF